MLISNIFLRPRNRPDCERLFQQASRVRLPGEKRKVWNYWEAFRPWRPDVLVADSAWERRSKSRNLTIAGYFDRPERNKRLLTSLYGRAVTRRGRVLQRASWEGPVTQVFVGGLGRQPADLFAQRLDDEIVSLLCNGGCRRDSDVFDVLADLE